MKDIVWRCLVLLVVLGAGLALGPSRLDDPAAPWPVGLPSSSR